MFPDGVDLQQYEILAAERIFLQAAERGDCELIELIHQKFGGMIYYSSVANQALSTKHFDFFKKYVLACSPTLLMNSGCRPVCYEVDDSDDEDQYHGDGWSQRRSEILTNTIYSNLHLSEKLQLVRDLCDDIFPLFPSHDTVKFPVGIQFGPRDFVSKLPADPLWEDPRYPHITQKEMERTVSQICGRYEQYDVLKYFFKEKGFRVTGIALQKIALSHYIEIFEFALQYLQDGVDAERARRRLHFSDTILWDKLWMLTSQFSKAVITYEIAKLRLRALFYKRTELIGEAFYILQGFYEIINGVVYKNSYFHDRLYRQCRIYLKISLDRPIAHRAQIVFDFLVDVLDDVISSQLCNFPVLDCSESELFPERMKEFVITMDPCRY